MEIILKPFNFHLFITLTSDGNFLRQTLIIRLKNKTPASFNQAVKSLMFKP